MAVRFLKMLNCGIFLINSFFGEFVEWEDRGRRFYWEDGEFCARRVYASVIGRFGEGGRAKCCHCGRVWACLAVDVTKFYFVGCDGYGENFLFYPYRDELGIGGYHGGGEQYGRFRATERFGGEARPSVITIG